MPKLLAIVLVAVGCGSKAPPPDRPVERAAETDAEVAATDAPPEVPPAPVAVPTDPAALQLWLAERSYKSWPHETGAHESAGPHGDVLAYMTPALIASLRRGKGNAHPKGVAAVKELYEQGKLNGWAVSVKVADDSADGRNWYWYEVLSTAPDAKAPYQGKGFELCRDCHFERGGNDLVQSQFPLK